MDANAPDQPELERLRSELSRLERERATEVAELRSARHRIMELEAQLAASRDRLPHPRAMAVRAKRVARRGVGSLLRRLRNR
ncbi:putative nucleic acid-binding Zn-ribbon protein [Agrococcus sp. UYP10]|uniref:hypothetical protein n=1 Tax=Agrococcus sp. UYP10 TaxID=1756355 RepID=UPI003395B7AB